MIELSINMTFGLDSRTVRFTAYPKGQSYPQVGAATLLLGDNEIVALSTLESYRRRGVATQLVERCEEFARAAGLGRIFATTALTNEASIGVWENMGYQRLYKFEKRLR